MIPHAGLRLEEAEREGWRRAAGFSDVLRIVEAHATEDRNVGLRQWAKGFLNGDYLVGSSATVDRVYIGASSVAWLSHSFEYWRSVN